MIHEIVTVGMLACNCSIVGDEASGEAVVIDPGDEIDRVQEILRRNKLRVTSIIATHAHIDHVGGIEKLRKLTGAPVYMHRADLPLYQNLAMQAAWLGVETPEAASALEFVQDGETLRAGALALRVLWTPGHSPGSLALYMANEERVFSGDALFKDSIGRTDLWGGDSARLLRSIRESLLALPDNTLVFPGHGPETRIGGEREQNPFLREL